MPALLLAAFLLALPARAASPLEGSWRLDVVVMTRLKVPLLGDTVVETHKVMLAHFRADASGGLQAEQRACAMYARSNRKMAETWFPATFIAAMATQRYPVQVGQTADGKLSLRAELSPVRLGWDPALSPGGMPQEADDPGVVDADHDGQPGVTIHVRAPLFGTVGVFMVQHSVTLLEGQLDSPDRGGGRARLLHMEQRNLGATNPLFGSNVHPVPDPSGSWFSLDRVPEATTCATVEQAAPARPGSPAADAAADGSGGAG